MLVACQIEFENAILLVPQRTYKIELVMKTRSPSYAVFNGRISCMHERGFQLQFSSVPGTSNGTSVADGQFADFLLRSVPAPVRMLCLD